MSHYDSLRVVPSDQGQKGKHFRFSALDIQATNSEIDILIISYSLIAKRGDNPPRLNHRLEVLELSFV